MPESKSKTDGVLPEAELKKPRLYAVIMHNDDYTTMDFVVEILRKIFKKDLAEATAIMLDIHTKGSRVVSVFTYDVAVSKTNMALAQASERGFPLMITVREAMD